MSDIEKLKGIFLDNSVDEETYDENLKQITDWENLLSENEAYISWQEHDITKEIIKKTRETHRIFADKLSNDRTLTTEQRNGIFAKQDALMWIINLASRNAKGENQQIKANIKQALEK